MHTTTTRLTATRLTATRLTAIAAATLLGGGLATAPSASATPTTGQPASVAAAAPKVYASTRADIDGDRRADTTILTRTGSIRRGYLYTITTRTARGARSAVSFRVEDGGADARNVWWGTAGLDGERGNEIVVNDSPVGDGQFLTVFTWRRGALVKEVRPGGRTPRAGTTWVVANMPWLISGYTFTTDRRGRHVTHHQLAHVRGTKGKVSGTHTTYTWSTSRKTWVKTSTRRSGLVDDPYAQRHYAGLVGVTLR